MKKVLVYPGAFNPPHYSHAHMVEIALANIHFDEVWVIPSGARDDKVIETSYAERRILGDLFVRYLQTKTSVPVKLLTDELDESNQKKTPEVLRDIRRQADTVQLVGADAFLQLREKVGPDVIFLVIERPGCKLPKGMSMNDKHLLLSRDLSRRDISSTHVRALVRQGDANYKKLVPPAIAEYIRAEGLYADTALS